MYDMTHNTRQCLLRWVTIARGDEQSHEVMDEMEAQRRYPTPALFVRRPAGVEDGAKLDVAGAAKEIEMSNLRQGWAC